MINSARPLLWPFLKFPLDAIWKQGNNMNILEKIYQARQLENKLNDTYSNKKIPMFDVILNRTI
jgi:hypothetical protein